MDIPSVLQPTLYSLRSKRKRVNYKEHSASLERSHSVESSRMENASQNEEVQCEMIITDSIRPLKPIKIEN